jgi:Fe-S-cluster-containing dehydrogenase component
MARSILVDVNRCVGCWTCAMACKVAYDLPVDEYRMFVKTIGGGGTDVPGGKWPDLYMKWMPIYTQKCQSCSGCESTEGMPFCVYNCTTEALTCGDLDDQNSAISKRMGELKSQGYHVYEFPSWEPTKPGVFYAEKDI